MILAKGMQSMHRKSIRITQTIAENSADEDESCDEDEEEKKQEIADGNQ